MTVDSVSPRPASHFFESSSQCVSPDFAELQQATRAFLAAQHARAEGSLSLPSIASSRSNHSGGWTPFAVAQASFSASVRQPQPDQQDWAFRHEQLLSMHGNGTDLSFTTVLGIEITKPLASAHTNSIAEMNRRSRVGCSNLMRGNMTREVGGATQRRWKVTLSRQSRFKSSHEN